MSQLVIKMDTSSDPFRDDWKKEALKIINHYLESVSAVKDSILTLRDNDGCNIGTILSIRED